MTRARDLANSADLSFDGSTFKIDTVNDRVGIGTTSPATQLHIDEVASNSYATLRLEGSNRGGDIEMYQGTVPVSTIRTDQSGNMFFKTSGAYGNSSVANRLTILTAGNVGIGTDNPGDKLVVHGDGARMTVESADYEVAMLGRRGSSGSALDSGYLRLRKVGVTADGVVLDTDGNSWLNGGNIGIGTNSPGFPLSVEKDNSTWVSRIYNTGSDADASGLLVRTDATSSHDALALGVYADSGYKMVVRSTGNVGIGTTSPDTKLHVAGTQNTPSGASKGMLLVRADGSTHGLQMGVTGSAPWGSWIQAQDNNISAPYPLTLQPGGGNVGIGETSPLVNLDMGLTSPTDQVIALRQNGISRTTLGITSNYGVRVAGPSDALATGAVFEVGQNLASDGTTYQNTRLSVLYNGIVHVPDTSRLIVGDTLSDATSLSTVYKNSLQQYTIIGSTKTSVTHPGSASSTKYYVYDRATVSDKINLPIEVYFPNGVSNLAIRLYYNNYSLWVSGEAITGSTYSNAPAMGFRRYSFSHNYNGAGNYQNLLTNTENVGVNNQHMEFNHHGWDANESGGAHYFEFRHIASTGNTLYLQFQLHGSGKAYATGTWYYKMTTY